MFFSGKKDKVFFCVSEMSVSITKCISFISIIFLSVLSLQAQTHQTVDGTTGTPLGGIGAGAVKFNAAKGTFAIMTRPPADAYDFKTVKNAGFQLFTKRDNRIENVDVLMSPEVKGKIQDDAIWPLHMVDFGKTNGVKVDMCAFSPFDNVHYNNMVLPYSFYEITVSNSEKSDVEVAIALQWNTESDNFCVINGKGIASKSRAIYAATNEKSIVTTGNQNDKLFLANGQCSINVTEPVAKVAVKVILKPHETRKIRYVIAWYEFSDPDLAYYFNLFKTPGEIAAYGLKNFIQLQKNAQSLVSTFRASNLPDWLKNQTLNTLANLTTNSMYKKDGRFAFAEGQWTCFGTMDQMWHARQIFGQLVPFFAWQELRYWARTQMKNGQIHHDHNLMEAGSEKEKRSLMVAWDDTEHTDYRKIEKWVDLNAAMIISTYEIYQMTNDKKEMNFFWPFLKKAAQRMLDQVKEYGSKEYPFTFDYSENSYDAGGDPNPFNASISAVAYKILRNLSAEYNDSELELVYDSAYKQVVSSFEKRYLTPEGFKVAKHCESYYTGQWLALHLQLGEIWSAEKTDFVLEKLDSYYHPFYWGLSNDKGTYDEWTPYILNHYGGLLLNTKRTNQWYVMQKDAYERQYLNKDFVFNHPLNILPKVHVPKPIAKNISSDKQYISIPALWRNYYDLVGVYMDKRTSELRIKPKLIDSIGSELSNVPFFTPSGNGYLSCSFTGSVGQNKKIILRYDKPQSVSKLYLEDNFGQHIVLKINGKSCKFQRVGSGYSKELAVEWKGKIDKKGIRISIAGDAGTALPPIPPIPVEVSEVQQLPILNGKNVLQAETATLMAGVSVEKMTNGNSYVSSCNNFDYIQFSNVDFGKEGVTSFTARVATPFNDVNIEIALGDVAGEVIGNCLMSGSGSYLNFTEFTCSIKKQTGIKNIILRFSGTSSENLMNIDWIMLK